MHETGVFDLYSAGLAAIAAGELVKLSGENTVEGDVVEADIVAGKVVGKSMEATAAATPETIEVNIGVRG